MLRSLFSDDTSPLDVVLWRLCVDLLYIVLLHDYRNRSHTNCSSVDIPGTPFDTHCKHQISLECPECPVSRNGLPYSPIADFTDITSYMNIFCTPVQCAIDSSFKVNNDTCHIWSAEHPNLKFPAELYTSLPASWVQWFCVALR